MRKGYIRAASVLTAVLMLLTACSAPGTESTTETAKQTEKAEENMPIILSTRGVGVCSSPQQWSALVRIRSKIRGRSSGWTR